MLIYILGRTSAKLKLRIYYVFDNLLERPQLDMFNILIYQSMYAVCMDTCMNEYIHYFLNLINHTYARLFIFFCNKVKQLFGQQFRVGQGYFEHF